MILLPLFVVYSMIQSTVGVIVIGSYWAMIVTYLTFAIPFALWLMVNYLLAVPRELDDAALVDGCTPVRALWRVVLPVATPGIVVALLFAFLLGWNDVLFASVLTNGSTQTLAIAVQVFATTQFLYGASQPRLALLLAAGVVSALPVVIVYLGCQRYLVTGLSAGTIR
jgi:multiple sugar transport system permease protein